MPYKVTAPVARSTAYDFNAQLSTSHVGAGRANVIPSVPRTDAEVLNVMPHEILFQPRHSMKGLGASRLHCCSSLNGITIDEKVLKKVNWVLQDGGANNHDAITNLQDHNMCRQLIEELDSNKKLLAKANDALTEAFHYMGIAVTGCTGGAAGALQRQGFSASRGGLMTVINTGEKAICAGQRVRMQFDIRDILRKRRPRDQGPDGIPHQKIIPRLVAIDESSSTLEDALDGISTTESSSMHIETHVLTPEMKYMGREAMGWQELDGEGEGGLDEGAEGREIPAGFEFEGEVVRI